MLWTETPAAALTTPLFRILHFAVPFFLTYYDGRYLSDRGRSETRPQGIWIGGEGCFFVPAKGLLKDSFCLAFSTSLRHTIPFGKMWSAPADLIAARDNDQTQAFLDAIKSPFYTESQANSAVASLGFSLGLAVLVALLFCFLRPYNNVVYAPRAKYADSKHAPPPVSKGLFGWIPPILRTKEQDLVERVGLDAAVFMRVCRMLRNIFSIVAVLGMRYHHPCQRHRCQP